MKSEKVEQKCFFADFSSFFVDFSRFLDSLHLFPISFVTDFRKGTVYAFKKPRLSESIIS